MTIQKRKGVKESINEKIEKRHFVEKLCRTCFMNGESCIYRYDISKHNALLKKIQDSSAFMLMPFGGTLEQVYESQIKPCIHFLLNEGNGTKTSNIHRSDDASLGAGYIICQRICRQIQESQLVCAEISSKNSNVFYELGFAFALQRDISLFMQNSVCKEQRDIIMGKLGIEDEDVNLYTPFEMLQSEDVVLWDFCLAKRNWLEKNSQVSDKENRNKDIQYDNDETCAEKKEVVTVILADTTIFIETVAGQELEYGIHDLSRGAIHGAIDGALQDKDIEEWKKNNVEISDIVIGENVDDRDSVKSFYEIKNRIEKSSIVIICTSQDEPMSYFWLGFSHGIEKTVIPITPLMPRYKKSNIKIKESSNNPKTKEKFPSEKEKLPFDVRALWHIHFYCNEPGKLQKQLEKILDNAINGLSKNAERVAQKMFWKDIEEAGSVSIYVGSAEIEIEKRHAVGEWDYKTVSEITGYYTVTNKAIKLDIEAPIIQKYGEHGIEERSLLQEKIKDRNSIIIGSPDINDMSEVVLSAAHGLKAFSGTDIDNISEGVVAVKSIEKTYNKYNFFQSYMGDRQKRGFYVYEKGERVDDNKYLSDYYTYDSKTDCGYSIHYAYLSKFKLERDNIVLLQGSTGPATLALAQILTGCINHHYTIFCDKKTSKERLGIIERLINDGQVALPSCKLKNDRLIETTDGLSLYRYHISGICEKLNQSSEILQNHEVLEAIFKVCVLDGAKSKIDERLIAWIDFVEKYPRVNKYKN